MKEVNLPCFHTSTQASHCEVGVIVGKLGCVQTNLRPVRENQWRILRLTAPKSTRPHQRSLFFCAVLMRDCLSV